MYCLKVREGAEKYEVRRISSAFVPTYLPAPSASESSKERKIIIPGYIFTLQNHRLGSQVPPEEWQIIEALSDSRPTVINGDGKIISGPFMGLENIFTSIEEDAADIRVSLLESTRYYRIRIRHGEAEDESSPDETQPGETAPDQEETNMEYTQERINMILEEAEKNGVHAAGKAYSIPWQTIISWARKAGRQITPKKTNKPAKGKKNNKKTTIAKKAETLKTKHSPLEIENAALRERIANLEEKLQKLQNVMNILMN